MFGGIGSSGPITANFGASAFSGAVPSGFTSGLLGGFTGGTAVASPTTALSTTWAWLYRTDQVDPATSAAWAPTAVDSVQIGPLLVL
jgi:hypothetical protein